MSISSIGMSLAAVIAVACAVLAGATIWLLLSDPVTVTGALHDGTVTPIVRALAQAVVDAFRSLLAFL